MMLKAACHQLNVYTFGRQKATELKRQYEYGMRTPEEIADSIDEMAQQTMQDEPAHKKQLFQYYNHFCKRVHVAASRKIVVDNTAAGGMGIGMMGPMMMTPTTTVGSGHNINSGDKMMMVFDDKKKTTMMTTAAEKMLEKMAAAEKMMMMTSGSASAAEKAVEPTMMMASGSTYENVGINKNKKNDMLDSATRTPALPTQS